MTHQATISKDFTFSASHQLGGLPDTHPCSRLHGHNYTVRVSLTGATDETGFVIDYRDLSWFKDTLDDTLDHRHLNDAMGPDFNPTAENLAHELLDVVMATLRIDHEDAYRRITQVSVAVSETPKTWATATSTRPWDYPQRPSEAARLALHWPGPIEPHEMDEERYRWNPDSDARGRA